MFFNREKKIIMRERDFKEAVKYCASALIFFSHMDKIDLKLLKSYPELMKDVTIINDSFDEIYDDFYKIYRIGGKKKNDKRRKDCSARDKKETSGRKKSCCKR